MTRRVAPFNFRVYVVDVIDYVNYIVAARLFSCQFIHNLLFIGHTIQEKQSRGVYQIKFIKSWGVLPIHTFQLQQHTFSCINTFKTSS